MEVNTLYLVNKSSHTTASACGILTFFKELVIWSRLLPKLCIDELHVINYIKATRVLTLNRQLCANE